MNRELSEDVDGVLQIQGFNTLLHKAIAHAPVYLEVTQTTEGSNTKYQIDQKTSASIPAVKEVRITDWEMRESKDPVGGAVRAKAGWTKPGEVHDGDFLSDGWLHEGVEHIEAYFESVDGGWKAHQIWGFRRHQRPADVRASCGGQEEWEQENVKLVYEYQY